MEKIRRLDASKPQIKYFLIFFSYLTLYNWAYGHSFRKWEVYEITYSHFIVDFKMGFLSSLFVGDVYHKLFGGKVLLNQVTAFNNVIVFFIFIATAYMLSKLIVSVEKKSERKSLFILIMFFISGPCSYSVYTRQLGMLDMYIVLFAVLMVIAVKNKYLRYSIPVLCALVLLVHMSSFVSAVFFIIVLLLYKIAVTNDKKERKKWCAVLIATLVVSIGFSYYLVSTTESNLVYDMDGFQKEMRRRYDENGMHDQYYDIYYLSRFYDIYIWHGESLKIQYPLDYFMPHLAHIFPEKIGAALAGVLSDIKFNFGLYTLHDNIPVLYVLVPILIMPFLVFFIGLWVYMFRKSSSKLEKLVYILFIIMLFASVIFGMMFSTDTLRWYTLSILASFASLFFVYKQSSEARVWITKKILSINIVYIAAYFTVYSAFALDAYNG